MKKAAAVLVVALAACGGNDRTDPAARQFAYGAAVAPSPTESTAATAGETSTSSGVTLQAATATDPAAAGSSIISLPDLMAAEVWSNGQLAPLQGSSSTGRTVAALGGPTAAMAYGFDNPACLTIVPTQSITYTGCTVALGTGQIHVDGKITLSGAVLAWDLTSRMTDAATGYSLDVGVHATGSLTFGATTVNGQARSDTRLTATSGPATVSAAYTTLADVALVYQGTPFCVTGGTLELRRVWTQRPVGAPSTGAYADQGLRFSWQGCGTVLVQHSI